MINRFQVLFTFALVIFQASGRDITVQLYSNQQHTEKRKVSIEAYVAAALAGETAGFQSEQALEAMAVAARTYAVRFVGRHKSEGFDFCDTTHCQDVRFSAVTERLRQAAEATEGELLWFAGAPAATFYSKDCGGSTAAGALVWPDLKAPYLARRADPYCARTPWSAAIRKADLRYALSASGIRIPSNLDMLRISERTLSGRALRLQAGGSLVSASSLRFAVGRALGWDRIRSDLYELSDAGDRFLFEGRGSGHGVGLCQSGAERMGTDGRSYRQILEFYYPGTALGVTAQGLSWRSLGGERVEVITTRPSDDQALVALADRLSRAAEQRSGLRWEARTRLKVFPTVAAFRDSTGEPGWVAASSRGRVIRLQPASVLRSRGTLEKTLKHELLHSLVESHARAGLPTWFREGVVLYLAGAPAPKGHATPPEDAAFLRGWDEARRAYIASADSVSGLVAQFGEPAVMSWIERGLPAQMPGSTRR